MKESINLMGALLGYVCQYDPFKCVQIVNMSNVWHSTKKNFGKPKLNKLSEDTYLTAQQELPEGREAKFMILLINCNILLDLDCIH